MRKISYRSEPPKKEIKPTSDRLPSIGSSDSATESAGRAGFLFPALPDTHPLPDAPIITEHVGLIEDFLSIADELDDDGLEVEADFFDFLIKKIASVSNPPSEEEKYIEYIFKLYNSDIPNSLSKIKNLTTNYSEKVAKLVLEGSNKEASKKISFNSVLLKENNNDD